MFSFSFASKMLNTIMGTEEGQPGQPGGPPGGPGHPMQGQQPQQQHLQQQQQQPGIMRPMGPGPQGFPQVRPQQQQQQQQQQQGPGGGPGGSSPRPGFPGPPTFSGPRPSPGIRTGPPSFGGPPRPTAGGGPMGTPHRFNGPQPPPQQSPLPGQMPPQQMPPPRGMMSPQQQQQQQQQLPGGVNRAPSPGSRPRGPGPGGLGPNNQPFPQRPPGVAGPPPPSTAAPVPEVDLSHLSAEERAMIESVMAKAQQLDQGPPAPTPSPGQHGQMHPQRMIRPEAQELGMDPGRICPICRQKDISGKDGFPGQECTECRSIVCNRCGGMSPHPETKRPEWTCGTCINKRRQRMGQGPMGTGGIPPGHQQQGAGHRPMGPGPYGSQLQQPMQNMDMDGGRRGSGVGLQGSPQQQIEREFDKLESKEMMIGIRETDTKHRRRPSFEEIFSPEKPGQIEELIESPLGSPVDLDFNCPINPTYPDHPTQSMITPTSASASHAKPSFVTNNKLHSRSISIDMAEQQPNHSSLTSPQNGYEYTSLEYPTDEPSTSVRPFQELSSSSFFMADTTSTASSTLAEAPPVDEKTNALLEELSKLQSAVDNTLKRRQRQKESEEEQQGDLSYSSLLRSPSPSPSPMGGSPGKSGESMSPLPSPERYSPDQESPEEEEGIPGPRKAIVLREHDLDDYKSSSDEESESEGSDEERKVVSGGEVYYDHSPGEVYTIPEEEDEGGSPTGGDLVTSLKRPGIQPALFPGDAGSPRRRMPGQEMLPGVGLPHDPRQQPIRPQLRPQRSLDNKIPSNQAQMDIMGGVMGHPVDQQGNMYAINNNVNTHGVNQTMMGGVDSQSQQQGLISMTTGGPASTHQTLGLTSTSSIMSQQASQQQPQQQQQSAFSSRITGTDSQQQLDMLHRLNQQSQQPGQMLGDTQQNAGGLSTNEWNNTLTHQSMMGPVSSTSAAPTVSDQQTSGLLPPYQQQTQQSPNAYTQQLPTTSSTDQTSQHSFQQQQPAVSQGQTQFQQQQTSTTITSQGMQSAQQQPQSFATSQQYQTQSQAQQSLQPFPSQGHPQSQQDMQNQQNQMLNTGGQSQVSGQIPGLSQPQQQLQTQTGALSQQTSSVAGQTVGSQQSVQRSLLQSQQLQQLQTQQAQAQHLAQQQQQQWQQQPDSSQQHLQSSILDSSGRFVSTPVSPYSQQPQQSMGGPTSSQQQDQFQQSMGNMIHPHQQQSQYQQQQGSTVGQQHLSMTDGMGGGHVPNTSQAGPGAKSISGLLADFSRALGLGTSPRPSPSEDKSLNFPIPSSGAGITSHHPIQPLSPYDQFQQQHPSSLPQQQSAFASIHDSYQRQNQQLSYLPQSSQSLQYGTGSQAQQTHLVSSSQQYAALAAQQQSYQVMSHGSMQQQQQAENVGVGVIGALSPAQAHMYQQQMAMQHQQQHMKKRGRGSNITSGDMRRDGQQSTVLIGGQGLAVTPSGMTIGALTPAVVTSLGTFIGGSSAILGTQLIQQPMAGTHGASPQGFGVGLTPLGTPLGTPVGTPRSGRELPGAGDSSDTMSETDSQKSLRMRRKLPCLPPDQEAAPLPSTKKRERQRSQEHFRSLSPMRMTSTEGTVQGRSFPFSSLSLSRPSASESNLRQMSMTASETVPRPGSALGLLQASSVVSSMGGKPDVTYPLSSSLFSTSSTFPGLRTGYGGGDLTGFYPSQKTAQESWNANLAELAACLPPDLRHLLNKGGVVGHLPDHELSGLSGIAGLSSGAMGDGLSSSQLPSYMRTLREQLQEERRQLLSEERRRLEQLRERDRELGARLDAVTSRANSSDGLRSRAELSRNVGISRSAGASPLLTRKLKGHRRQLSDPKLSLPFSPIQEDGDNEIIGDYDRVSSDILRPPYKSYEYESLEDSALLHHHHHRHSQPSSSLHHHHHPQGVDWDHSQSYLTSSSWAAVGGMLRETAINSMGGGGGPGGRMHSEDELLRSHVASRFLLSRRNSEGESGSLGTSSRLGGRRVHQVRKHRKSRSWHPSPYVSEEDEEEEEEEDEEDLMSREEKKARIKAEIARRRQQMQERGGHHHHTERLRGDGAEGERHSVLKSVDQLIRDQYTGRSYEGGGGHAGGSASSYGRSLMYSSGVGGGGRYHFQGHGGHHGGHGLGGGGVVSPCASEEDRSIERIASTFRSGDELYYERRLGEISPMATDSESMGSEGLGAPAAMPILPDMPTRSRRLLEDLGSAPIGLNEGGARGGSSSGQSLIKGQRKTPAMGFIEPPPGLQVDRSHHPGRRRSSADDRVSSSITHQTFMKEPPPPPSRRSSRDLQVYSRISSDSSGRARHSGEPPQQLRQRRASSERRPSRPFPPPPSSEEVHDFRQNRAYAEYPNDSVEYGHELVSTSSKYAPSSYVSDNRGPEGPPNQTQPARIPSDRKLSRELSKKKVAEAPQVPQEEESEYKSTKSQTPTSRRASKEYPFPVKCFLLKRDPHDVSLNSNGVGMKLVGGKELPGSNLLAAYVSKIVPGSVADTFDDIYEGDVVLEWNGASLENKTFEEVASILHESLGEKVSVVMRSDYNIQTGKPRPEDSRAKYSKRTSISSSRRGLSFSSQSIYEPQQLDEGEDSGGGVGRSRCGSYVDSEGGAQLCGDEPGERMLLSSLAVRKDSGGRMVKSPSSSTEATTTSVGTSSIHQSTNVLEDVCSKVSHHLAIPSEIDLRKRSTTSLPPSLADARDDPSGMYSAGHYGRKGSENLSVKSMGQGEIGKSKRHHRGLHGLKKGTYGSVQLQICHDPKASILYVTVLRAKLPKQRNDGADHVNVDPYVTVYLLPDKVLENQRRTRHYPMCSSPQFNQTMVYPNITVSDLKLKYLEVSAKNYNPTGDEDSLFGKVILYLSDDGILDEQPHTYSLRLEDKPFRRKSSPTQWKSQHSLKPTESKESCDPNVVSPRCSFTGENCNELPQQESSGDAATTSRNNSRYALGKIAIFSTGNIPGSSAVVPTDCHGAFCSIL